MQADGVVKGVLGVRRPHPSLMTYYLLESLLLGPLFPHWLVPRFLLYRTLCDVFDATNPADVARQVLGEIRRLRRAALEALADCGEGSPL